MESSSDPLTSRETVIVSTSVAELNFIPEFKIVGFKCESCGRNKLAHLLWPGKCAVLRDKILARLDQEGL